MILQKGNAACALGRCGSLWDVPLPPSLGSQASLLGSRPPSRVDFGLGVPISSAPSEVDQDTLPPSCVSTPRVFSAIAGPAAAPLNPVSPLDALSATSLVGSETLPPSNGSLTFACHTSFAGSSTAPFADPPSSLPVPMSAPSSLSPTSIAGTLTEPPSSAPPRSPRSHVSPAPPVHPGAQPAAAFFAFAVPSAPSVVSPTSVVGSPTLPDSFSPTSLAFPGA